MAYIPTELNLNILKSLITPWNARFSFLSIPPPLNLAFQEQLQQLTTA